MLRKNYSSWSPDAWFAIEKVNGYYCRIDIIQYSETSYFVSLSVSKKRKNANGYILGNKYSNTCKTNIGSGIQPLVWAKTRILEFMEMEKGSGKYLKISGADGRRFKVYKWALSKIGFQEQICDNEKTMIYKM